MKRIKKRVYRLVIIFIVLTLFCGLFSLTQLASLNQKAKVLSGQILPKGKLSVYLRINLPQLQQVELRLWLSDDIDERKLLLSQIELTTLKITDLIDQYQAHQHLDPEEAAYLEDMEVSWEKYLTLQKLFIHESNEGDKVKNALLIKERSELYRKMTNDAVSLMDCNGRAVLAVSEDTANTYQKSKKLIFASMLISLVVGSIVIVVFQRQMERQESLQNEAYRDSLTGLYNRRYLLKQVEELFGNNSKFALIMIDIDRFKQINDNYGHDSGDIALKVMAKQMMRSFRAQDLLARYGGEEFIVLLPETTLSQATEIAERLRQQAGELTCYTTNRVPFNFTISAGVVDNYDNLGSLTQLFKDADRCLYAAKQNGRNRVVSFIDLQRGDL